MSSPRKRTSGGVELTEELIERLAEEAEQGYDPAQLRPRARRGRPPMGSAAAVVFQVRLEPELYAALSDAATQAEVSPSELTRVALRDYLGRRVEPPATGDAAPAADASALARFAEDLRRLREAHGLTVRQLSDSIGRSPSTVYAAMSGRTRPTWDVLRELLVAFGADPAAWRSRWESLPTRKKNTTLDLVARTGPSRGTTLPTRAEVAPQAPGAVGIASLAGPLDPHASQITHLIARLSREARQPSPPADGSVARASRVEYLRSAVGADAVAYLSYTAGEFTAIDATARFDLDAVRHLLRTAGNDVHFALDPRWFGHVAEDGNRRLWCAPLNRAEDKALLLAVADPPSWLVELGQPGVKVLETIWRADFAASPAEAEIQVLTALRAAFGRLPQELVRRCLLLYREVLESFRIVFQPVVTIDESPAGVGVHSYEALIRRSLREQSAPQSLLQVAHLWGDHFVVERDKIILGKALSAYALAHADGPWEVPKPVSVNVSVRSLLNDSYVDTLRYVISAFHLDPASVTLEISEQDAIEPWAGEQWPDAPHTHFLNRLTAIARDVGVTFAVDNFGAGYASVSRMAELPLTQIKVDRAGLHHRQALQELDLVVAVARDAVERGAATAARTVIVEGVDDESPLTLRQIYARGIKHVQGHITGERGAPELRRLNAEVRKDIAARVRGDDENHPDRLSRQDRTGTVTPLRKSA